MRDTLVVLTSTLEASMATQNTLHSFPLRIDRGLRSRLDRLAEHDGRKVSELARDLLRSAAENRLDALARMGELTPNEGHTKDEH